MLVKLNLGCGHSRRPGFLGLDILPAAAVDLVCNLNEPLPIADSSVNEIYAKSVLEHISNLEGLLSEINRVLVPGSVMCFYVPHWSNPFYYSDYTHCRFFGLSTFDYFAEPDNKRFRKVPNYSSLRLHTLRVHLHFHSYIKVIHWLLKLVELAVNRNSQIQLFYEAHIAPIIPCYAVEFWLQKPGRDSNAVRPRPA